MFQDVPDDEVAKTLATKKLTPPKIFIIKSNGQVKGQYIVADGVYIDCCSMSGNAAILMLLAVYYVFDLEYPRMYSQLLGLLQTHLLDLTPYTGQKSSKYRKLSTDLQKAIANQGSE